MSLFKQRNCVKISTSWEFWQNGNIFGIITIFIFLKLTVNNFHKNLSANCGKSSPDLNFIITIFV